MVQPLLITALLFALPPSRYAGGPAVGMTDMRWATLLVAALAAFLLTATPTAQIGKVIDTWPAVAAGALSLTGVAICLAAAHSRSDHLKATILGVAAGIALAGSAALIKVCTDLLQVVLSTRTLSPVVIALAEVGFVRFWYVVEDASWTVTF